VTDRLGRKTSLILNSFPVVCGYFTILSTYLIGNGVVFKVLLMVGRFLTGVGAGWVIVSVTVKHKGFKF
jgi:MFS family permease